jgi:hypothetical protein
MGAMQGQKVFCLARRFFVRECGLDWLRGHFVRIGISGFWHFVIVPNCTSEKNVGGTFCVRLQNIF